MSVYSFVTSLIVALFVLAPAVSAQFDFELGQPTYQHQLKSTHFTIHYNTSGAFEVTDAYAQKISEELEKAYQTLVVESGFTKPLWDPLPVYINTAGGSAASKQGSISTRTDFGDDYWELHHELFHILQFSEWDGTIALGAWFMEGSGNWAGYYSSKSLNPWVGHSDGWYDTRGASDIPFEQRAYDNVMFFVYLSDNYGGADIMKKIMTLAPEYSDPPSIINPALKALGYTKTFDDVFAEFALNLYTLEFKDERGKRGVDNSNLPSACDAKWEGKEVTIDKFCKDVNGKKSGSPLQVKSAYGIEYIKINPGSAKNLSISFASSGATKMILAAAGRKANNEWDKFYGGNVNFVTMPNPKQYEEIIVALTRGYGPAENVRVTLAEEPKVALNQTEDTSVIKAQIDELKKELEKPDVPTDVGVHPLFLYGTIVFLLSTLVFGGLLIRSRAKNL